MSSEQLESCPDEEMSRAAVIYVLAQRLFNKRHELKSY